MKTVLLSTAGSVGAAQLIEALAPWRDRIRIIGLAAEPAEGANFRCDRVHLVPPSEDRQGWTDRVSDILLAERPDLVLPTREGDLVPLAGLIGDPAFAGMLFWAPGPRAAAMLVDKRAAFRFAQAHGQPFAETATEGGEIERLVARTGFPILAKPRLGAGAAGVRIVRSWDQVQTLQARADPVFQEYLDDRGILDLPVLDHACGMPLLHAFGGRRTLSIVGAVLPDRRRVYCGAYRTLYRGLLPHSIERDEDARLESLVLGLGDALERTDFQGVFTLQAVPFEDRFSLPFAYDGHLSGMAGARWLLGISEVPLIAQLLCGPAAVATAGPAPARRLGTVWRAEAMADADVSAIAEQHRWERRSGDAPPAVTARHPAATPVRTLMLSTCGNVVAAMLMTALEPWRNRIRIVGLTAEADAVANFLCDVVHLVPPVQDRAAWQGRVAEILRDERPDLVMPTRDGDLIPLAGIADAAGFPDTCFFTAGPHSASWLSDKAEQVRFARRHALPFADTAVDLATAEGLIARTGFPVLAKPRRGTGAQGIRLVGSWDQARRMLLSEGAILQAYIGDRSALDRSDLDPRLGMPLFAALERYQFLSAVGAVLPDRRIIDCGAIDNDFRTPDIYRIERVDNPALAAMTVALGTALAAGDFTGFFNFQAVRAEDGALVPIEYNGRLVGSSLSRRLLNISEVPVLLHLLLGENLPAMPGPPPAAAVVVVPRAEILPVADADALARDGVWARTPTAR